MLFNYIKKHSLYFSFVFALFTGFLNEYVAVNYPYYEKSSKELYDVLFHYLTPPISDNIPNILLLILIIYFIVKCLSFNKTILKKFFLLVGIMYIFRVLLFTLTETPVPNKFKSTCISSNNFSSIKWNNITRFPNMCIDNMYSGHSMISVAIMMFILTYTNSVFEKTAVVILTICILLSLIWSRLHYTQDVLVALLVTTAWSFLINNTNII